MSVNAESNSETSSATGAAAGKDLVVLSSVAVASGADAPSAPAKATPAVAEVGRDVEVAKSPDVAAAPVGPGDPLEDALAALDRKDYATAQRLFEALGRKGTAAGIQDALAALERKDYASANRLFEALGQIGGASAPAKVSAQAMSAQPKLAAPARGAEADKVEPPPKLEFIPRVEAAYRGPRAPAGTPKRRSLAPALMGTGLVLLLLACAAAFYSPRIQSMVARYSGPLKPTLALAKSEASAGLTSAAGALESIAGPSRQEEEQRAAQRDLSAALTQVNIRLDQIEHEYTARLDKLGERIDQDPAYRVPDIVQRLDRLEQKTAASAGSGVESADVAARLERLEKKAAAAPAPAVEFAEITARLDKLERRAAIAVAPSELTAVTTRLDKLEKRLSVASAGSPLPLPQGAPRPGTLIARADAAPPNDIPKPIENPKPLLRGFNLEDVRDGVAIIDTREGPQQVGPGDLLPGAGRVLRIERRNGEWFVVTSLGVIASDPGAY